MKFLENISLAEYTTFKIGGPARFFCIVKSEDELIEAVKFARSRKLVDAPNSSGANDLPILILGGGSNMLVSDAGFNGLVIKMEYKGIDILEDGVTVSACAGESWDSLVEYSVQKGLYGLENLSAIPGTVGAAPVQNIGAYGAEVSDNLVFMRVLDLKDMKAYLFSKEDCRFGYRDSIFKRERGRYVILVVAFKLSKGGVLKMDYKDVREYLNTHGMTSPSLVDLRKAIIDIRTAKLPDWKKWGTAGSFFKNPNVSVAQFDELKAKYPGLPGYPEDDGTVKVSLGWILDKVCDARGLTFDTAGGGKVGTYGKQALVLVAQAGAKAEDVLALSRELMHRVKDKTGIVIEAEVEWVC